MGVWCVDGGGIGQWWKYVGELDDIVGLVNGSLKGSVASPCYLHIAVRQAHYVQVVAAAKELAKHPADGQKPSPLLEADDGEVSACSRHHDAVGVVGELWELLLEVRSPFCLLKVVAAADHRDDELRVELEIQTLLDLPFELDLLLHELQHNERVR